VPTQFWHYLVGLAHGDLGVSYRTRAPVAADLRTFLPATLELAAVAMVLALALAVLLAWPPRCAAGRRTAVGAAVSRASTPAFFVAIAAYRVLPVPGRAAGDGPAPPAKVRRPDPPAHVDALLHGQLGVFVERCGTSVLPATRRDRPAISIGRVLRSSLVSTLGQDYVRTARARGCRRIRVLAGHVLRNSAARRCPLAGCRSAAVRGVLVVESIFAWPGLDSTRRRACRWTTSRDRRRHAVLGAATW